MKTFTDKEAMEWCNQWPLQFEFEEGGCLRAPKDGLTYRVDISKMPWRDLLSTARSLAHLGCHSVDAFSGGLVWIRRTGIAVPEMEQVVVRALERFRLGFGENRSLETARAHLFRSDESAECSATLLLILLAEWDAYLVHPSGDWVAFIDNDDQITVTAKSAETAKDLKGSLETWGETTAEIGQPKLF
jgi:hypothetical protein